MAQQKTNQSEGEFFALVATGRKGVEDMLDKMGPEMRVTSAPNVRQDFSTWSQRALVEISNRDELTDVLKTRTGIFSVYKALSRAATMGIQFGGQFPHAYLTPKDGKAILVPTAEGLGFVAAHGPGAVLSSIPELVRVYDKDEFHYDKAGAQVVHKPEPFKERGKLVGYYMRLVYRDGHIEIPTITRAEVVSISDEYSMKVFSNGKKAPAWSKSPEAMYDKTAAKQLLKKPAKEAEGLAMLMQLDDYEPLPPTPPGPDLRDVTERAADRLDKAAEALKPQGHFHDVPEDSSGDGKPVTGPKTSGAVPTGGPNGTSEPEAADDGELDIFS